VTVNRDADIVVMTTEIYRNMLYAAESGRTVGGLEWSHESAVNSLFAVVLDEFHFLNHPERGTVWEESVIISPPSVLICALSATLTNQNARELTDWINAIHGPTKLIHSHTRPVPLRVHFATRNSLEPLFEDATRVWRNEGEKDAEKPALNPELERDRKQRVRGGEVPRPSVVVKRLVERGMVPVIYFVFSRMMCDRMARQVAEERGTLVTASERDVITERLDTFLSSNAELEHSGVPHLIYNGVAAHHAGILPLWKAFIEELFQDGLIKVVFATETLAAGINMPAKTTVISAMTKRSQDGYLPLSTSDTLQMAGRAGRRGKDSVGHVVIVQSLETGAAEAHRILTNEVEPLTSKFAPNYGLVLNILQKKSLEESRLVLERSFGNFIFETRGEGAVFEKARQILKDIDLKELKSYITLRERVKDLHSHLSELEAKVKRRLLTKVATNLTSGDNMLLALQKKYILKHVFLIQRSFSSCFYC